MNYSTSVGNFQGDSSSSHFASDCQRVGGEYPGQIVYASLSYVHFVVDDLFGTKSGRVLIPTGAIDMGLG
jgi:hypothetical protein